jgi:hypothetical protein
VKVFRYELGHKAGETMTVSELAAKLKDYPADMPVMAAWEGCYAYIDADMFFVEDVGKGHAADICACLVIDVNGY